MALTNDYITGTEAISTTEWSLVNDSSTIATNTNVGVYWLLLDLSDMIAGDELQLRVYEKVRSGDTQRILHQRTFAGAQGEPNWMSIPYFLGNGWDFTLDAIAGTITVLWSIRRMT